jgi:hypothetical protein
MTAKQRCHLQPSSHIGRAQQWLCSERRIIVDDEVLQVKTGTGKKAEMHRADFHSAAQRRPN